MVFPKKERFLLMVSSMKWAVPFAALAVFGSSVLLSTGAQAVPVVSQDSMVPSVSGRAVFKLHASTCFKAEEVGVAARNTVTGAWADYPGAVFNVNICPDGFTFVSDAPNLNFRQGQSYSVFGFYRSADGVWHNLPAQTLHVPVVTPPTPVPTPTPTPPVPPAGPVGPAGPWTLKFGDDFNGTAVDTTKWGYKSSAEADWSTSPSGTGNPGNQQLEFDQPANCAVGNGVLTISGRHQAVTSASGHTYQWTSCLLTSTYAFRYGYIEERSKMPATAGWWPALWTWAAPGQNLGGNGETDAYEVYTDNQYRVYQTQHNPGGGGGVFTLPAGDGVSSWHTYGVDIEPAGTTWYVDGVATNHTATTSAGSTNIIDDMFAYSQIPPTVGATKVIDFVRAWQH